MLPRGQSWHVSLLLLLGSLLTGPVTSWAQVLGTQKAPDFAFETTPYGWLHLHDLCSESAILLVFDPSPDDLLHLQGSLNQLATAELAPVAITRQSDDTNWGTVEHLQLSYALMSDPAGCVSEAFGLESAAQGGPSTWVVIDGQENIRAVRRGGVSSPDFAAQAITVLSGGAPLITARPAQ